MSFRRVAIVNRGEPAMRLINAVKEYRVEHDVPLVAVALYTEPDRHAAFVSEADEAFLLGPARIVDDQQASMATYVHRPTVLAALEAVDADAVWTGWGFVSEDPIFAEECESRGIVTIGPGSETMRLLGDKIASKQLAERSDVPVAPWSGGPVETVDEAFAAAARIGYPAMLKATAGGGGRGIRLVRTPEELERAFEPARREAASAFGNPTLFLESLVPSARHIEVQIVGDRLGTVWALGVRDCSVQRRNQKVIEEAPSPALSAAEHREVAQAAVRIGQSAGYQNVGTVEFLYEAGRFAFMEVNTRLQVEHPITELTTGIDLVKLQLTLALGGVLEGEPPQPTGHAIELRLTAEDADAGFAPAPGLVEILRFPHGPGIRVDAGIEEGDEVVPDYDSMIAKVIGHGANRGEAVARLHRALAQTSTVIRGGTTNKGFLQALLEHPDFLAASIDVGWIDRMLDAGTRLERPLRDVALVTGAITAFLETTEVEHVRFQASAARGRPEIGDQPIEHAVALRFEGRPYEFEVANVGPDAFTVWIDGLTLPVRATEVGGGRRLSLAGRSYRTLSVIHGARLHVEVDGTDHRMSFDEGGVVRAPSPAVVVTIDIRPGDDVSAGDRLAVIEAMKMETTIDAEFSGTVRDVLVHPNLQVAAGSPLVVIDLREERADDPVRARIDFAGLGDDRPPPHRRCIHRLQELKNALLGYDVDLPPLIEAMKAVRLCSDETDESERQRIEDDILQMFVDMIALFRRQPPDDEGEPARRGPEDYLFDYMREIERRGAGQPRQFVALLDSVLQRHGADSQQPGPALWAALHRSMRVRTRLDDLIPAVTAVLEDRIEHLDHDADPGLRNLLDRMASETRERYPTLHDLAVDIRYRLFEAPFVAEIRERAYRAANDNFAALRNMQIEDPGAVIQKLVDCPQPLAPIITRELEGASPTVAARLLEVMIRRYYRIRELTDLIVSDEAGGPVLEAGYGHEDTDIRLVATAVTWEGLRDRLHALRTRLESDDTFDVVLDVYLVGVSRHGDADALSAAAGEVLDDVLGDLRLRRIVVAATPSDTATSIASVFHFTFRPQPDGGYAEQRLYRDLHPMMGKRLELRRLQNFTTKRLPTLEDIYLFHGTAKDNPADERLFAIAEVRDTTRVIDPVDGTVRLPELERVFNEVIGSIHRVQAERPPTRRLMWNRVLLYVWPRLEVNSAEMDQIMRRIAPSVEGAGLAKVVLIVHLGGSDDATSERVLEISGPTGSDVTIRDRNLESRPIRTMTPHEQRMIRLRQRGLTDPFDLLHLLTAGGGGLPPGTFQEHDLEDGRLVPVDRPPGSNQANIVVGVLTTPTTRYPEGIRRVILLGDPGRGMGNVSEPECRRIIAGLDLAEDLGLPLDWFAVSSGARISMESGTENMDWVARVLRRLIEYTQAGREVNVVVTGVNVGAQPYWNAEATMLMHTRGILIMTSRASMVLTGKEALDFSGGVSAEDNFGIGGYSRVMGPNGQAQYFAQDVHEACSILFQHHRFAYIAPGEQFARRAATSDPLDRNVGDAPHGGDFETVSDVFSDANRERKHPFEIRRVMAATVDSDLPTLERWYGMQDAEVAVVWDAFLGGFPVTLLGLESKSMARTGHVPADGPEAWTAGTLFPRASKKVARAINAASGNRPVVVLANLSGFDGSPESMRRLQLEYGAEIGRAVVNFQGPMVFCVVSRYHGGAFVVFSAALNERLEVAAVEGAKASVIGGAPAAAVVFARDVNKLTDGDPRVVDARRRAADATGADRSILFAEADRIRSEVHAEYMHAKAEEFDSVHSVERAKSVGSVHHIISVSALRPYLVDAVERGMNRSSPQ